MTTDDKFNALVLDEVDGKVVCAMKELRPDDLPDGDVTVRVAYSDLNYKDGMILGGLGRMVRKYPHIPGIDLSGTVEASSHADFAPGDEVLVTGHYFGERHWGGYTQKARVKGEWLIKLPEGLSLKRAMALGTAGHTAMLALMALEREGLEPGAGEVLVTGAGGGLGGVAVALLANLGYDVAASTGRAELHDRLTALGAKAIVARDELSAGPDRPLMPERWAGAIDSVGGQTLASIVSALKFHSAVGACGLTGGNELTVSVLPFLLRGVRLIGIDSSVVPATDRRLAWRRLAEELPMEKLDTLSTVIGLDDVIDAGTSILKGATAGRVVVDVNA